MFISFFVPDCLYQISLNREKKEYNKVNGEKVKSDLIGLSFTSRLYMVSDFSRQNFYNLVRKLQQFAAAAQKNGSQICSNLKIRENFMQT